LLGGSAVNGVRVGDEVSVDEDLKHGPVHPHILTLSFRSVCLPG